MIASYSQPDKAGLEALAYDNTPPMDEGDDAISFDNKRRNLDSLQYKAHAVKRQEKQQLIRQLHAQSKQLKTKQIQELAWAFQMVPATVKKYLAMCTKKQLMISSAHLKFTKKYIRKSVSK